MARRRTKRRSVRVVRASSTSFKRARRSRRKSNGSGLLNNLMFAFGYGAVREPISNAISPLASRIPIINASDELALLGTAFIGKKFIRNGTVKKFANTMMIVESARLGQGILSGQFGNLLGNSKSENNGLMQTVF